MFPGILVHFNHPRVSPDSLNANAPAQRCVMGRKGVWVSKKKRQRLNSSEAECDGGNINMKTQEAKLGSRTYERVGRGGGGGGGPDMEMPERQGQG